MSYSLRPHGLQLARLPCPSLSPGVCPNSCPWVSDAIQPSHPLSSPSPPAFNLSQHQGLFHELALHIRWPKYWSFSFSISPSNEYSGLISVRIDWFDLLAIHFGSVQFSLSVVSDALWPHGLRHARPPCPSPTPRVYLNSCPLSRWCHPPISSSVVPFSSSFQSFPTSGSFQMSQFFASVGQRIRVSASVSVLWTGWISLLCRELSRVFSNITVQKHQFFGTQLSLYSNCHIHTWLLEKP